MFIYFFNLKIWISYIVALFETISTLRRNYFHANLITTQWLA